MSPATRSATPPGAPAWKPALLALLLVPALLAGCLSMPTALPSRGPGAAATLAAHTLQALAPSQTLSARLTADRLTRQAPAGTPSPTPTRPTATPIPSNTPPFSLVSLTPPTLTPSLTVTVILSSLVARFDTNCRVRPAPEEERLAILYAGQSAIIYGSNSDQSWFYIQAPSDPTLFCWVWTGAVALTADTAGLPLITPATPYPYADFEASFSNIHDCWYDRFLVFRVENTGTRTLLEAVVQIQGKGGIVLGEDILHAPYMKEAQDCPPGRYALEAGQRGFIYMKKLPTYKAGMRLWAVIEICTAKDPKKACVTKTVQFTF